MSSRRALLLLLLAGSAAARADWTAYRAAPLEVLTNGGDRPARELLATFDQLRWLAAKILGRTELNPLWPVRLVVVKKERGAEIYRTPRLELRRDAYSAGMLEGDPIPRQWLEDFARRLLADDTGPLPPAIENGLVELLASIEVSATRIQVKAPADPARRTRDWARMHLLAADPGNGSRIRVFFSNLQQAASLDTAYRNSFGKTDKEMEAEVDAFFKAAAFPPQVVSGKPISLERDYRPRQVLEPAAPVALAGLLAGEPSRKAFLAVLNTSKDADAFDGAGLYAEAVAADSKNARAWLEYGKTLPEAAKSWDAFQRAAQLNPRWEEPHTRLAALEKTPERRIPHLKKAIELAPRSSALWMQLVETQLELKDFAAASQSWRSAERTAPSESERARIEQRRKDYEQQRIDLEAAERRRQQEEKEKELAGLKEQALASIRAAEARANAGASADPNRKVVDWWDEKGPRSITQGTLERVDCLQGRLRLAVRSVDGKLVQYLIPDPGKIALAGGGERTLGCGPQKPPRKIKLDYAPKPDTRLGTAGEILSIEFQ